MFADEGSETDSKSIDIKNATQEDQSISKTDDITNVFTYSFLHGILVNLGLIPLTIITGIISSYFIFTMVYNAPDSLIGMVGPGLVIVLPTLFYMVMAIRLSDANAESISEVYSSYDINKIPADSKFDIIKYNKIKSYKNMMKNVSCAGSTVAFLVVSVIVLFTLFNG